MGGLHGPACKLLAPHAALIEIVLLVPHGDAKYVSSLSRLLPSCIDMSRCVMTNCIMLFPFPRLWIARVRRLNFVASVNVDTIWHRFVASTTCQGQE